MVDRYDTSNKFPRSVGEKAASFITARASSTTTTLGRGGGWPQIKRIAPAQRSRLPLPFKESWSCAHRVAARRRISAVVVMRQLAVAQSKDNAERKVMQLLLW